MPCEADFFCTVHTEAVSGRGSRTFNDAQSVNKHGVDLKHGGVGGYYRHFKDDQIFFLQADTLMHYFDFLIR